MTKDPVRSRKPPDALGKLFEQLGTRTSEKAMRELIEIGMPAIERLIEAPFAGEVVEAVVTDDRVSVKVRELVGVDTPRDGLPRGTHPR